MSSPKENAVELATSSIRYGAGVTREIGLDLADRKLGHVMLFTDPTLASLPVVRTVRQSLDDQKISYVFYYRVRVEPTDRSYQDAIDVASAEPFDAFVAVGGGSTIDTAKAANLYSTHPADFLDYVNPPIGKGLPVPGPLKPLFAIPTTAGTGSETTGVAIFDFAEMHAKTGIAHRMLKPTLGLLDPENTRTLPPEVAASTGPHGMSYPVSGMVKEYRPPGYAIDRPLVPHGVSVILNAPAVFRFTAPACPERHLSAAEALGADVSSAKADDAGTILADTITGYMQRLKVPNGLRALGYDRSHIPALVEGTIPQHRVTKLSPRPAGEDELAGLFEDALTAW